MRRALGLDGGAILMAELQGGRIVLTPAMVVETQAYSDAEVAQWQQQDSFKPGEYAAVARKLAGF